MPKTKQEAPSYSSEKFSRFLFCIKINKINPWWWFWTPLHFMLLNMKRKKKEEWKGLGWRSFQMLNMLFFFFFVSSWLCYWQSVLFCLMVYSVKQVKQQVFKWGIKKRNRIHGWPQRHKRVFTAVNNSDKKAADLLALLSLYGRNTKVQVAAALSAGGTQGRRNADLHSWNDSGYLWEVNAPINRNRASRANNKCTRGHTRALAWNTS